MLSRRALQAARIHWRKSQSVKNRTVTTGIFLFPNVFSFIKCLYNWHERSWKNIEDIAAKMLFLGSVNYQDAAEQVAEESPKPKVKTI